MRRRRRRIGQGLVPSQLLGHHAAELALLPKTPRRRSAGSWRGTAVGQCWFARLRAQRRREDIVSRPTTETDEDDGQLPSVTTMDRPAAGPRLRRRAPRRSGRTPGNRRHRGDPAGSRSRSARPAAAGNLPSLQPRIASSSVRRSGSSNELKAPDGQSRCRRPGGSRLVNDAVTAVGDVGGVAGPATEAFRSVGRRAFKCMSVSRSLGTRPELYFNARTEFRRCSARRTNTCAGWNRRVQPWRMSDRVGIARRGHNRST